MKLCHYVKIAKKNKRVMVKMENLQSVNGAGMVHKCKKCHMVFTDKIRLKRHETKAHPKKRKISTSVNSDFNHVIGHSNFI